MAWGCVWSHWVAIPYAIGTWGPAAGEIGVGFKPPPSRIPRNLGGVIGGICVLCLAGILKR